MIRLFSLKQQKKEGESSRGSGSKRASAAQLRITKDINDLSLPKTCKIEFPDPDDLLNFKLVISPDEPVAAIRLSALVRSIASLINDETSGRRSEERAPLRHMIDERSREKLILHLSQNRGFYRNGQFDFSFKVGQGYPHDAPKVKCETKVYHPNIDLEGNICLNILREDWKPVLTINSIIYGLQYLFLEPNPDDPLNKDAAEVLRSNRRLFEQNVSKAMRGGYLNGIYFERCLGR